MPADLPAERQWMGEFPKVRDTIRAALQIKCDMAELELTPERIKAEQKRLADLGDFDGVGHVETNARSAVKSWQGQLKLIDTPLLVYDVVLDGQRLLRAIELLLEGFGDTSNKFIYQREGDVHDGEIFELVRVDPVTDPDLAEYQQTHHLKSEIGGRIWEGAEPDFNKCFKKL